MSTNFNKLMCVIVLLGLSIASSGCMGIQGPVFYQNPMQMTVPVQPNPVVLVTPDYSVHTPATTNNSTAKNIAANATVEETVTVVPATVPRFVYV